MEPDNPNNVKKISSGHKPAYVLTTADTFLNGKVSVVTDEYSKVYDYAFLAMSTTLQMENLQVVEVTTTTDKTSSSYGAMTLYCKPADQLEGDLVVQVRTTVFTDGKGNLLTADTYLGKIIDVKGIVDAFDGVYQIKVLSKKDITVKD